MEVIDIQKYIAAHTTKLGDISAKEAYSIGRHPAIYSTPAKHAPDYRISVPIIKSAVDQTAGYMAKPGNISYNGENYNEILLPIYNSNEEQLVSQQNFKNACIFGASYELHWFENGEPQFSIVPNTQAIPVYSNDLRPKLNAFIWIRYIDGESIASVYDANTVTVYNVSKNYSVIDSEPHGYRNVPVVVYKIDQNGRNLFDHVLPLADALDRLYSHDMANEAEKLANAYLLLRDRLTQDDMDNLKETTTFHGLGDNVTQAVAYLTKDIPTGFLEFSAKSFHDMIYETLQIPNPDSQSSTPSSGFSLVVKNMTFENLCASMEGAFIRGLQDRIRLICGHVLIKVDPTGISIKMHRNTPYDIEGITKTAANSMGILDLQAILDLYPSSVLSDEAKARILNAKKISDEANILGFSNNELPKST